MKKYITGLLLLALAGCGISVEEKTNQAIATCNVMSEYSESDGALRIKEVNAAREKIREPLFLGSSDQIEQALKYDLCEALLLNEPDYDDKLTAAIMLREQKFAELLMGFWLFSNVNDEYEKSFVILAEFVPQKVILSRYFLNKKYEEVRQMNVYNSDILDETRVVATGENGNAFFITFDRAGEALSFDNSECEGCNFKKAPQVVYEDIKGAWLQIHQEGDEPDLWLSRHSEGSVVYESRRFNRDEKTYEDAIETCRLKFEHGFVFTELCGEAKEPNTFFLSEYDDDSDRRTLFSVGTTFIDRRVGQNYAFPQPPDNYSEAGGSND